MATQQELDAKIDELGQTILSYEQEKEQTITTLQGTVTDLQAKLDAASQPGTSVDLQPEIDKVQGLLDTLKAGASTGSTGTGATDSTGGSTTTGGSPDGSGLPGTSGMLGTP